MLRIKLKFFEGTPNQVESEFNKFSEGKYIHDTSVHIRRNDVIVMKVVYAETGGDACVKKRSSFR